MENTLSLQGDAIDASQTFITEEKGTGDSLIPTVAKAVRMGEVAKFLSPNCEKVYGNAAIFSSHIS